MLFKALLDQPIPSDAKDLPPYDITERIQLGLKIVNPKDKEAHPISYRLIDTPGNIAQLKKGSLYAFRKVDLIMIFVDSSKKIDEQALREWSLFAIQQVSQFHRNCAILQNLSPSEIMDTESMKGDNSAEKVDRSASKYDKFSFREQQPTFGQTQ